MPYNYTKKHLKGLQQVSDLEGHSKSSETVWFNKPHITFLWAVCSNNISIVHHDPDITIFTVYVIA